jgi:hypothetical protein
MLLIGVDIIKSGQGVDHQSQFFQLLQNMVRTPVLINYIGL